MNNEYECRYTFEESKCKCVYLTLNNNEVVKINSNNCYLHNNSFKLPTPPLHPNYPKDLIPKHYKDNYFVCGNLHSPLPDALVDNIKVKTEFKAVLLNQPDDLMPFDLSIMSDESFSKLIYLNSKN